MFIRPPLALSPATSGLFVRLGLLDCEDLTLFFLKGVDHDIPFFFGVRMDWGAGFPLWGADIGC